MKAASGNFLATYPVLIDPSDERTLHSPHARSVHIQWATHADKSLSPACPSRHECMQPAGRPKPIMGTVSGTDGRLASYAKWTVHSYCINQEFLMAILTFRTFYKLMQVSTYYKYKT